MGTAAGRSNRGRGALLWVVLLSPLLLPALLIRGVVHVLYSSVLYAVVWKRHDHWVVFVYSDSPNGRRT